MPEERSRDRVDVGEGVLGLSVLGEDSRSDLEELLDGSVTVLTHARRRRDEPG